MMGACFMDQIVNNYLSKNKLDEGTSKINNNNKIVRTERSILPWNTWDEAYGYVYGVDGTKFWSSYIDQVNADADFNTIKQILIWLFAQAELQL
jgi:hypothetical protein